MKAVYCKAAAGLLGLTLLFGQTAPARAALDASKPYTLFDFEKDTQGWTSGVETSVLSHGTDPQFASQGSTGSLKVDLTGHNSWSNEVLKVALPEATDLSQFAFVSADIIVPAGSRGGSPNPTWAQFGLIAADPYADYGNRDIVREGLNHFVWSLDPEKSKSVTGLRFYVNQGEAWAGPVYLDNVTLLPGKAQGLTAKDQVLVAGLNTTADVTALAEDIPHELNTDQQFITEGAGSLKIDLTGLSGWNGDKLQVTDLPPVDLSGMDQLRADVYVPQGSLPTDWSQMGITLLTSSGAQLAGNTHGLAAGWRTLVWDFTQLPADQKAALKEVTGYKLALNNGAAWTGPIYLDAIRGSKETAGLSAAPVTVKGDLNGNGKQDISDVLLALRFVAGMAQPTAEQTDLGDVSGNGKLEIGDVLLMLRTLAGL